MEAVGRSTNIEAVCGECRIRIQFLWGVILAILNGDGRMAVGMVYGRYRIWIQFLCGVILVIINEGGMMEVYWQ